MRNNHQARGSERATPISNEAFSTGHTEGLREAKFSSNDLAQRLAIAQLPVASEKAVTTQIAELALKGHAVHHLVSGGFMVCKYGMAKHCADFAELQAFAKKLGVTP